MAAAPRQDHWRRRRGSGGAAGHVGALVVAGDRRVRAAGRLARRPLLRQRCQRGPGRRVKVERRKTRELAVQILFQVEVGHLPLDEVLATAREEMPTGEEQWGYVSPEEWAYIS